MIEADVVVVVRHARLDSRQDANALLSAIAYAGTELKAAISRLLPLGIFSRSHPNRADVL